MRWNFRVFFVCAALVLAMGVACAGGLDSSEESALIAFERDAALAVAPAATLRPSAVTVLAPTPASTEAPTPLPRQPESGSGRVQPALLPQNRIIVHTARISLVVVDVAQTVDSIADVAQGLGGWVVTPTERPSTAGASPFACQRRHWTKRSYKWRP